MKEVKALKNFKCNGVKKKAGQVLSEEEKDKIGDEMGEDLLNKDFIQISEASEEPKVEVALEDMERKELVALAKKLKVEHDKKANKKEIIALIKAIQKA